jgi:fibronectin type 3 domain-containing protein
MDVRPSLVTSSAAILAFAAIGLLPGCVGVSTTTAAPASPGAPTHTVGLSWNASASADVMGYNVYRAVYTGSCGPFTKINVDLTTSSSYADAVTGGTSYCYATTAVDARNQESDYSNIVSDVQIPSP